MNESIHSAHSFGMRSGAADMPYSAPGDATGTKLKLWAGESFEFSDLLDFVNPLQHLPGISYLYRELTGDKIGALARVVGGGLLGGPIGAVASLANAILESETGDDIGGHAIAFLTGETEFPDADDSSDGPAQYASMSGRGRDPVWDQSPGTSLEGAPVEPDSDLAARETAVTTSVATTSAATISAVTTSGEALVSAARPRASSMSERGDDQLWRDAANAPSLAMAATQPVAALQTVDSKRRSDPFEPATGAPVMLAAAAPETADMAAPSFAPETEADTRPPGPWLAEAMSSALDKYQDMARLRLSAGLTVDAAY